MSAAIVGGEHTGDLSKIYQLPKENTKNNNSQTIESLSTILNEVRNFMEPYIQRVLVFTAKQVYDTTTAGHERQNGEPKEENEFPYIDQIEPRFLAAYNVVVADPGRISIMTMMHEDSRSDNKIVLKYSKDLLKKETKARKYQHILQDIKSPVVIEAEILLSLSPYKTVIPRLFNVQIVNRNRVSDTPHNCTGLWLHDKYRHQ